MSITMVLVRWLTSQLAAGTQAALGIKTQAKGHQRGRVAVAAAVRRPLQWRAPWLPAQLLSLFVTTLLAPTFWGIGILLMIDARSDHPFFWPAAMAIVAVANVVAIVCANQRQHRRAFASRGALATYYFAMSALAGSALILLLGWETGALRDFAGQIAALPIVIAACYSLLSFAHAGLLHAWLAFE
jgi:hypothetical protein